MLYTFYRISKMLGRAIMRIFIVIVLFIVMTYIILIVYKIIIFLFYQIGQMLVINDSIGFISIYKLLIIIYKRIKWIHSKLFYRIHSFIMRKTRFHRKYEKFTEFLFRNSWIPMKIDDDPDSGSDVRKAQDEADTKAAKLRKNKKR